MFLAKDQERRRVDLLLNLCIVHRVYTQTQRQARRRFIHTHTQTNNASQVFREADLHTRPLMMIALMASNKT